MTPSNPFNQIVKIGSNGEILPPNEIRDYLGLLPNQTVIMSVVQDKLIIRKVDSLDTILNEPPKVTISYHAWKQMSKELNEDL